VAKDIKDSEVARTGRRMSTFEKATVAIGVLSLATAVGGGVLGSYVTYKWFDPSSKEIEERGTLVIEQREVLTKDPCASVNLFVRLKNVGHRPLKSIEIFLRHPDSPSAPASLSADSFVLDAPTKSKTLDRYVLTSPIQPGDAISLTATGRVYGLTIRTGTVDPSIDVYDGGFMTFENDKTRTGGGQDCDFN
jgi:hypothetical protein